MKRELYEKLNLIGNFILVINIISLVILFFTYVEEIFGIALDFILLFFAIALVLKTPMNYLVLKEDELNFPARKAFVYSIALSIISFITSIVSFAVNILKAQGWTK